MKLTAQQQQYALIGGGVAVLLLWGPQLARWLAEKVGAAAAGIPIETATGIVLGVGDAVGIPRTDVDKCQAHVDAGEWLDASFYCPAGTFLKEAGGAIIDVATGTEVGTAPPSDTSEVITIRVDDEIFAQWLAATGGVLKPGQTQQQAALEWFNAYVAAPF